MIDKRTSGQKLADKITQWSGSWSFIVGFGVVFVLWVAANAVGFVSIDVFPFLFLNLILNALATFLSPLILMSQNRQNETDRETVREIVKRLELLQVSVDRLTTKEK